MQQTLGNAAGRTYAVIRFKQDIQFPRFSMMKGERWSFVVYGNWIEHLSAIKSGNRFPFAGGQCLAEDVEIIYEGPAGAEHSRAAGYIE